MERSVRHDPMQGTDANRAMTPSFALRQARIIVASLILGVALFYGVTLFLEAQGTLRSTDGGFSPSTVLLIWGVLALGAIPVAVLFRNRAAGRAEEARRAGRAPTAAELGEATSNSIIAAALLEGPALFAGAMAFITGSTGLLAYAGVLFLAGMVFVFPRAEWFGADPRRP